MVDANDELPERESHVPDKVLWHVTIVRAPRKELTIDKPSQGILKQAQKSIRRDRKMLAAIDKLRSKTPLTTCAEVAAELNRQGIKNSRGGEWNGKSVSNLYARIKRGYHPARRLLLSPIAQTR